MKILGKLSSLALIALIISVSSCKKDDPQPSRTALLTAKSWQVTKIEFQVGSSPAGEVTSDFQSECEADDIIKFATTGVYTVSVGADDCDGDQQNETGTWALSSNDSVLTITEDGDVQSVTIASLSSSQLKFKESYPFDSNGDGIDDTTGTLIFTLAAK